MSKLIVFSTGMILATVNLATAGDLKSGLQPGDVATPFDVKEVSGPNKGVTLCYR